MARRLCIAISNPTSNLARRNRRHWTGPDGRSEAANALLTGTGRNSAEQRGHRVFFCTHNPKVARFKSCSRHHGTSSKQQVRRSGFGRLCVAGRIPPVIPPGSRNVHHDISRYWSIHRERPDPGAAPFATAYIFRLRRASKFGHMLEAIEHRAIVWRQHPARSGMGSARSSNRGGNIGPIIRPRCRRVMRRYHAGGGTNTRARKESLADRLPAFVARTITTRIELLPSTRFMLVSIVGRIRARSTRSAS